MDLVRNLVARRSRKAGTPAWCSERTPPEVHFVVQSDRGIDPPGSLALPDGLGFRRR